MFCSTFNFGNLTLTIIFHFIFCLCSTSWNHISILSLSYLFVSDFVGRHLMEIDCINSVHNCISYWSLRKRSSYCWLIFFFIACRFYCSSLVIHLHAFLMTSWQTNFYRENFAPAVASMTTEKAVVERSLQETLGCNHACWCFRVNGLEHSIFQQHSLLPEERSYQFYNSREPISFISVHAI